MFICTSECYETRIKLKESNSREAEKLKSKLRYNITQRINYLMQKTRRAHPEQMVRQVRRNKFSISDSDSKDEDEDEKNKDESSNKKKAGAGEETT